MFPTINYNPGKNLKFDVKFSEEVGRLPSLNQYKTGKMIKNFILTGLTLIVSSAFTQTSNKLEITVDPRIELLSIIQYIADRTPLKTIEKYK